MVDNLGPYPKAPLLPDQGKPQIWNIGIISKRRARAPGVVLRGTSIYADEKSSLHIDKRSKVVKKLGNESILLFHSYR